MAMRPAVQILLRRFSQSAKSTGPTAPKPTSSTTQQGVNLTNVTGLSSRCVKQASGPVGPGASATGEYKVPEYFCFDRTSYFEAEIEMAKYRCPQPSALKK